MTDKTCYMGIATPQANPTVEIEFQRFYRGPIYGHYTRLTSGANTPAERLLAYLEQTGSAIDSFDTLPIRAFGFACTGSAYLAGRDRECELSQQFSDARGIPVITATEAIRSEFTIRKASRIAILAPYPQALCDAASDYWRALGFDIVATARIDTGDDTRGIYQLTYSEVATALARFDSAGADVVLLSGTGMPTIDALLQATTPMLSSNLCLATEMLRQTDQWPVDQPADIRALVGTPHA